MPTFYHESAAEDVHDGIMAKVYKRVLQHWSDIWSTLSMFALSGKLPLSLEDAKAHANEQSCGIQSSYRPLCAAATPGDVLKSPSGVDSLKQCVMSGKEKKFGFSSGCCCGSRRLRCTVVTFDEYFL